MYNKGKQITINAINTPNLFAQVFSNPIIIDRIKRFLPVAPPNNHTGGIYESYGRGWLIKPDNEKDKYLKMGEWNKLTIKAYNDNVTTWLNGFEMISIDDEMIGKGEGRIALQIHDGGGIKVKWRNLSITELN